MTLDPSTWTWTCNVCGDERPDTAIDVVKQPIQGMEDRYPDGACCNVRYCTDRPACVKAAFEPRSWTIAGRPA
jgi:hypothetical protein